MSSREIAELVESRHDHVKISIERLSKPLLFNDGAIKREAVIQIPPMRDYEIINGLGIKTYGQEYLIGKRESYIIVAQLSPAFTARLVDRWQELEAKEQKPVANLSDASTLRELLLGYTEQVIQLQATVDAQKPAVAFHEAVKSSVNSQTVEEVAKTLGTGRNRLYQILRQAGLLKPDNLPYQEFINRGYFELEIRTYKDKHGDNNIYHVTMVTGKGFDYIHGKFF